MFHLNSVFELTKKRHFKDQFIYIYIISDLMCSNVDAGITKASFSLQSISPFGDLQVPHYKTLLVYLALVCQKQFNNVLAMAVL